MSYSRWSNSKWYIFPHEFNYIAVWRAGDKLLNWYPDETYEEFLKKAEETLTHDGEYAADFKEMKRILEENMDEIKGWFLEWS